MFKIDLKNVLLFKVSKQELLQNVQTPEIGVWMSLIVVSPLNA